MSNTTTDSSSSSNPQQSNSTTSTTTNSTNPQPTNSLTLDEAIAQLWIGKHTNEFVKECLENMYLRLLGDPPNGLVNVTKAVQTEAPKLKSLIALAPPSHAIDRKTFLEFPKMKWELMILELTKPLLNLANLMNAAEKFPQASVCYTAACSMLVFLGDSYPSYLTCLDKSAFMLFKIGKYGDCIKAYEEYISILSDSTQPKKYGACLQNLGLAYEKNGQREKAIEKFESLRNLQIYFYGIESPQYLETVSILAMLYTNMNSCTQNALAVYRQYRNFPKKAKKSMEYVCRLGTMGNILRNNRQFTEAQHYFVECCHILRSRNKAEEQELLKSMMATLLSKKGKKQRSGLWRKKKGDGEENDDDDDDDEEDKEMTETPVVPPTTIETPTITLPSPSTSTISNPNPGSIPPPTPIQQTSKTKPVTPSSTIPQTPIPTPTPTLSQSSSTQAPQTPQPNPNNTNTTPEKSENEEGSKNTDENKSTPTNPTSTSTSTTSTSTTPTSSKSASKSKSKSKSAEKPYASKSQHISMYKKQKEKEQALQRQKKKEKEETKMEKEEREMNKKWTLPRELVLKSLLNDNWEWGKKWSAERACREYYGKVFTAEDVEERRKKLQFEKPILDLDLSIQVPDWSTSDLQKLVRIISEDGRWIPGWSEERGVIEIFPKKNWGALSSARTKIAFERMKAKKEKERLQKERLERLRLEEEKKERENAPIDLTETNSQPENPGGALKRTHEESESTNNSNENNNNNENTETSIPQKIQKIDN